MKKIIDYIKENTAFILLTIFFILLVLSEFIINVDRVNTLNNYKYLICFLIIVSCIASSILIYKLFKKNMAIEKIFLCIAIPLGLLYMVIVPLGRVPDELNHYYRAYDISRGNIFSKKISKKAVGNIMPDNVASVINPNNKYYEESINIKVKDSKEKKKIAFSNTAIYAPIIYAPQALGILIGNIFNAPIIIKGLLGRLFNYILFLVLMFYSLKLLPFKKHSAFLVLLFPILIQQSASLSADVFTNSVSILFSAYVLNLIYSNKKQKNKNQVLTMKQKLLLLLFVILIALSKFVYLPICLLLFLIPNNMFESKKEKYKYIILACIIAFVVTVISVVPSLGLAINRDPNVNFAEQVKYVLTHPHIYLVVLIKTLITNGAFYIDSLTISVGALDIFIPSFYAYLLLAISVSTFLSESHDFTRKEIIIYGLIVLLTFGLIMSVEYASWTPVANHIVEGIQGRYLFPIIIPIMLLFNFKNKKTIDSNNYKYLVLSILMINICVLIRLFYSYV